MWSGTGKTEPGEPVEGARVTVTDTKCGTESEEEEEGSTYPVQSYTTNAEGHLPDPGLPFSTYDVCASAGGSHVELEGVPVPEPQPLEEEEEEGTEYKEPQKGTIRDIFLGSAAPESGECP